MDQNTWDVGVAVERTVDGGENLTVKLSAREYTFDAVLNPVVALRLAQMLYAAVREVGLPEGIVDPEFPPVR